MESMELKHRSWQAPGFYCFAVGALAVTVINDGWFGLDAGAFSGDPDTAAKLFEAAYLPAGVIKTSTNAWLVETSAKRILIDAGGSSVLFPDAGRVISNPVRGRNRRDDDRHGDPDASARGSRHRVADARRTAGFSECDGPCQRGRAWLLDVGHGLRDIAGPLQSLLRCRAACDQALCAATDHVQGRRGTCARTYCRDGAGAHRRTHHAADIFAGLRVADLGRSRAQRRVAASGPGAQPSLRSRSCDGRCHAEDSAGDGRDREIAGRGITSLLPGARPCRTSAERIRLRAGIVERRSLLTGACCCPACERHGNRMTMRLGGPEVGLAPQIVDAQRVSLSSGGIVGGRAIVKAIRRDASVCMRVCPVLFAPRRRTLNQMRAESMHASVAVRLQLASFYELTLR